MKFDSLANSILNEDESLDQWHKAQMDKEAALDKKEAYKSNLLRRDEAPINDNFIDMVKSMPTDQLKGLFREDLYAYYELIEGSASEDRAQDRIEMIGNELLKRGLTSEELASIRDEAKLAAEKQREKDAWQYEEDEAERYERFRDSYS